MAATVSLADILELDVDERVRLVQAIWDSIAEVPEAVPISQAEKEELDRRLAEYRANPESGSPWAEVRDRLLRSK